jgi:hypothetical protein
MAFQWNSVIKCIHWDKNFVVMKVHLNEFKILEIPLLHTCRYNIYMYLVWYLTRFPFTNIIGQSLTLASALDHYMPFKEMGLLHQFGGCLDERTTHCRWWGTKEMLEQCHNDEIVQRWLCYISIHEDNHKKHKIGSLRFEQRTSQMEVKFCATELTSVLLVFVLLNKLENVYIA